MESGPANALFNQSAHPYTKGLIASLPRIRNAGTRVEPIPGHLPNLMDLPAGCIFSPRCPFSEVECKTSQPPIVKLENGLIATCRRQPEIAKEVWPALPSTVTSTSARRTGQPVIQTHKISKQFDLGYRYKILPKDQPQRLLSREKISTYAIRAVDLVIGQGEIVGLVGESGSGKSTLGRMLLRLINPTSGQTILAGQDITLLSKTELRPLRGKAQIIFQDPDSSLNPGRTIGEAIARPIELYGRKDPRSLNERVSELLDPVQLPTTYAKRFPHQLSGGEKQRVGIARALTTEPIFIVCDEAISALDVSVQAAIVNLLGDLRNRLGLALLFISHDLSVVAGIADRIVVLYRGAVCEIGRSQNILRPPYYPYTQVLLSAVPGLTSARQKIAISATLPSNDIGRVFSGRCPMEIVGTCDRIPQPVRAFPNSHEIRCHLEKSVLTNMVDVIKLPTTEKTASLPNPSIPS